MLQEAHRDEDGRRRVRNLLRTVSTRQTAVLAFGKRSFEEDA